MVDRPSPEWTSRQLTSSGPSDFLLETINGPVELPWPMVGWRELPQLLSPRMQEAEQWPATTHMRFDNGLYLRVEPVVHTFEGQPSFRAFRGFEPCDADALHDKGGRPIICEEVEATRPRRS